MSRDGSKRRSVDTKVPPSFFGSQAGWAQRLAERWISETKDGEPERRTEASSVAQRSPPCCCVGSVLAQGEVLGQTLVSDSFLDYPVNGSCLAPF